MIYRFQQPVYEKLLRTAVAASEARKHHLSIKPRFHRLVIGPSGSGKTHLAREVGRVLHWKTLELNVSSWIVMGSKETPTWSVVIDWLCDESDAPRLLILDEIDKISYDTSWNNHLRSELFDVLDGRLAIQAVPEYCDEGVARSRLNTTMVVACGAFQSAFDTAPSVGFSSTSSAPTSSRDLAKYLQREIVNRFDSNLLILPELTEDDYKDMLNDAIKTLPRDAGRIVKRNINLASNAVRDKLGARFVENLVSSAFYELTEGVEPTPWVEKPFKFPSPTVDIDDEEDGDA